MADAFVDERKEQQTVGDANDVMYMWNASRDFDPTPLLGDIQADVLVLLSQDDERNPVELPMLEENMALIPNAEMYIVPEDNQTRGHGTTYNASYYADVLADFMAQLPNAPE
jgi:homoserine O-acetyltransferase